MNKEAQQILDEITSKSVQDLTEGDIAFLKARQSYLSNDQKEKFAEVLGEEIADETKTQKNKKSK